MIITKILKDALFWEGRAIRLLVSDRKLKIKKKLFGESVNDVIKQIMIENETKKMIKEADRIKLRFKLYKALEEAGIDPEKL